MRFLNNVCIAAVAWLVLIPASFAFDQENQLDPNDTIVQFSVCLNDCDVSIVGNAEGSIFFIRRNGQIVDADFSVAPYQTQDIPVPLPPPGGSGEEHISFSERGSSGGQLGTFYGSITFTFTGGALTRVRTHSEFVPDSDIPCQGDCEPDDG